MKRILPFLIVVTCLLTSVSCSVVQIVSFDGQKSKSGSSFTSIEVDDFFTAVVEDLSSWKDTGSGDPVTDVAISNFAAQLIDSKYAEDVYFVKRNEHNYVGLFTFEDLSALVADLAKDVPDQNLLTMEEHDGKTSIELNLSLKNYDVLAKIVPFLADSNFAVWGPVYNNPPYDYLTEEDYKDLVSFILGEDGPSSIDSSSVKIYVYTPSDITYTDGVLEDSRCASFSFPLIDFLLLHEDITFRCEF